MTAVGKIDTHHHFFPRPYVEAVGMDALARVMPNKRAPQWSPDAAIAMMDAHGIDEAILSISPVPPQADTPRLFRSCNDSAAELRVRYPGRFGSFASLPLPDIDASLKEVSYCFDELKVDGFIIFTSYDGCYLGDARFTPLLEELNRGSAIVFVHPNDLPYTIPRIAPASVLEFPFDTTRTAASLIISGAAQEDIAASVTFLPTRAAPLPCHDAAPIAVDRHHDAGCRRACRRSAVSVRKFYFDTALSVGDSTLAALAQVADLDRILFGTDYPMAPEFVIASSVDGLNRQSTPGMSTPNIHRHNATRLLKRN
jgi:predicted TIM-barrel fold metal-dependent hydrolase